MMFRIYKTVLYWMFVISIYRINVIAKGAGLILLVLVCSIVYFTFNKCSQESFLRFTICLLYLLYCKPHKYYLEGYTWCQVSDYHTFLCYTYILCMYIYKIYTLA